ncbi:calcium-binding and coiled-coil domain-containing protein 2 [Biomphalaria glabrata]|nr:calcium-binding and coiled-coil domain-containing protein 2 [Biomphalaria glabrata]
MEESQKSHKEKLKLALRKFNVTSRKVEITWRKVSHLEKSQSLGEKSVTWRKVSHLEKSQSLGRQLKFNGENLLQTHTEERLLLILYFIPKRASAPEWEETMVP